MEKCKKTDLSCASDKDHRKNSHLAMKIRQVTGMVLAVLGMTIPFHKNKIEAAPLFDDENVLEGEILLKGRIYGIVVLKTAAELYFNKNIKYVIHRWRHKEVKHGERE